MSNTDDLRRKGDEWDRGAPFWVGERGPEVFKPEGPGVRINVETVEFSGESIHEYVKRWGMRDCPICGEDHSQA